MERITLAAPPGPDITAILARLPRRALEALAAAAIAEMDARDPDPDCEPDVLEENGDEDDGPASEWRPWVPVKRIRPGPRRAA